MSDSRFFKTSTMKYPGIGVPHAAENVKSFRKGQELAAVSIPASASSFLKMAGVVRGVSQERTTYCLTKATSGAACTATVSGGVSEPPQAANAESIAAVPIKRGKDINSINEISLK